MKKANQAKFVFALTTAITNAREKGDEATALLLENILSLFDDLT